VYSIRRFSVLLLFNDFSSSLFYSIAQINDDDDDGTNVNNTLLFFKTVHQKHTFDTKTKTVVSRPSHGRLSNQDQDNSSVPRRLETKTMSGFLCRRPDDVELTIKTSA